MYELAQRLMNLRMQEKKPQVASAIFGSASTLARNLNKGTHIRVAMYPAISQDAPETALGLMGTLALLLEQWQEVTVYRVFSRLEGDAAAFSWDMAKSQFSVDDWALEGLDDNVGIWGSLNRVGGNWHFSLEVENDFKETDDVFVLSHEAESLSALVNWLPTAAKDIITYFELNSTHFQAIYSTDSTRDEQQLQQFLTHLGAWEITLLLALWGKPWDINHYQLFDDDLTAKDDFIGWGVAGALSRALLPGYIENGIEIPPIEQLISAFSPISLPTMIFAQALYANGMGQFALSLLEAVVQQEPNNPDLWFVLAELYRRGQDLAKTIDTFQRAIEVEAVNASLLRQYAQVLIAVDAAGLSIDEFILIEPKDYKSNYVMWEALEAYEQALTHSPQQPEQLLSQQALLLIDMVSKIGDRLLPRLWKTFEQLVDVDTVGESVRVVVDNLYAIEDVDPAIEALETAVDNHPDRADLHINLAAAYLIVDDGEYAITELEAAQALVDDVLVMTDIEWLMLNATDPEFEGKMGEITDKINANAQLTDDEISFLEDVIEQAPRQLDAYLLLAKAYELIQEDSLALEVLLDAEKHFSHDADVLHALAKALRHSGEIDLSYNYLKRGIEQNPLNIALLSSMGLFLFEDDQREGAKAYLSRAEAIAPNDTHFIRARNAVAKLISDEVAD